MKKRRHSLVRSTLQNLRKLWQGRRQSHRPETDRRARFEFLEGRQMLNADPAYNPNSNFHIHAQLDIIVNGEQVNIPKTMGNSLGARIHTHDFSNLIHIHTGPRATFVTLDEIFQTWRNDQTAAGNPNATFSSTNILGNTNNATHQVRMYVNGQVSTDFGAHKIHDNDQIVVSYEPINAPNRPSFDPVPATNPVSVGAPIWLPLDGFDPNGGPLTYEVSVGTSGVVDASIAPGNRSLRMDVSEFGVMTIHLFDDLAPDVTNRIVQLVNQNFYNRTVDGNSQVTNQIIFHRVIDGFVIQAGDPTGTGSGGSTLPDFNDQFNVDLQHTSSGLLSMAKTSDDTNDSQFFITDAPTRHLDFNHSIFGRLTDGDEIRDAINSVPTGAGDRPVTPVVINSVSVVNDTENAVLKLEALPGVTSGSTNVTVTVRDAQNNSFSQTFQVTVVGDTVDTQPFLNPVAAVSGSSGQPITFQLTG